MNDRIVEIDYTNWRGERRVRQIMPSGSMKFMSNNYHDREQWLVEAVDQEDLKVKLFALGCIHSWRAAT